MSVHTPYQKHIWVTKEIIRRDLLQNIEDGIYQEQQDAEAAETALENALNTEELRAKAKETEIANNLTQEIQRATNAEQDLLTGVQGSLAELSERISNEYTRATGVESTLSSITNQNTSDIADEILRATEAEQALQTDIDTKIAGAYKPSGSLYFADLPSLTAANQGKVYYVMDAFTTTADFIDGAGISYPAGTYVAIIDTGSGSSHVFMYDAMSGMIDTSNFVSKTDIATTSALGISKPDGTTVVIDANGVLSATGSSVNPQGIGFGYGTCSTAASTTAKTASLTGYNLVKNGYVSVKFTNTVPAGATLNINSKGAKPIYYHGVAITANIIGAGDLATFVYDGSSYHLIGVDYESTKISNLATSVAKCEVLVVSIAAFNSLPKTVSNSSIEDDMVCIHSELSNASAQTSDWTVTTASGTATVSGSINGSTTLKLYLMKSR